MKSLVLRHKVFFIADSYRVFSADFKSVGGQMQNFEHFFLQILFFYDSH